MYTRTSFDIALDGWGEVVVGTQVGGKGVGNKMRYLDERDARQGGVVAAIVVVYGQTYIHCVNTFEREDNAGLREGAGLVVGQQPFAGVVTVAHIGQFDGQLVDGGYFGSMGDNGLHGDEGEVEGDNAVTSPFVNQMNCILALGGIVVLGIGLAVDPCKGLTVEHLVCVIAEVRNN